MKKKKPAPELLRLVAPPVESVRTELSYRHVHHQRRSLAERPYQLHQRLILGFILPSEEAAAQATAKGLVGTWTRVSITLEQDGKKTDFYGPN